MKLLIAGGGTGGHIFPGLAVADEVKARVENARVLFVGTTRGMEGQLVPKHGYSISFIPAGGLKGKNIIFRLKALLKLPFGFIQAFRIIHSYEPDVVLGTGGYVAGAVCLMARLLGKPVAIQEQNAIPGMTNRILGKFAHKVFLSFPGSESFFPRGKSSVLGNPIRKSLKSVPPLTDSMLTGKLKIAVVGGSQGARTLNQAIVSAFAKLEDIHSELYFIHQTGKADESFVKSEYDKQQIPGKAAAFYDNMADIYEQVHLVISRAGAGILEIAACGRPMILVPYPYAADDHQTANGKLFAENGAALLVANKDFDGNCAANLIRELYGDRKRLKSMGEQARELSMPEATEAIAKACIAMAPPQAVRKVAC